MVFSPEVRFGEIDAFLLELLEDIEQIG